MPIIPLGTFLLYLFTILREPLTPRNSVKMLTSKTLAFSFLEVLFEVLPLSKLKIRFENAHDKKNMVGEICKLSRLAAVSKFNGYEDKLQRWEYCCSAFRCLALGVSCTQENAKFFNLLVFKEDVKKDQTLWDNLSHPSFNYEFEVETSFETKSWDLLFSK